MPKSSQKTGECPECPVLRGMPKTVAELFFATAVTQKGTNEYAWPWPSWTGSRDALERLRYFVEQNKDRVNWRHYADIPNNDGQMSINTISGRALVERFTNGFDAVIERFYQGYSGPALRSPRQAIEVLLKVKTTDLLTMTYEQMEKFEEFVHARVFSAGSKSREDLVVDVRDYGIGMTAEEMPNTILSLSRGHKKFKHYLTGKHGQGASSTYQYSEVTVIASRKQGDRKVAFTFVTRNWELDAKTPCYKYLTVDGEIPSLEVPEEVFPGGTLVRHVGYKGELTDPFGKRSVVGLLERSLAHTLLPSRVMFYYMFPNKEVRGIGGLRSRLIQGTVFRLERAHMGSAKEAYEDLEEEKILHRSKTCTILIGDYDFGGWDGVQDAGSVGLSYWVLRRGTYKKGQRSIDDLMKNFVDPDNPILFTLDGQTHAEYPKGILTGITKGAGLWAVGEQMVVHIDCTGLTDRARYELFASGREGLKSTRIEKVIVGELLHRLKVDSVLDDLNKKLVNSNAAKSDPDKEKSLAELFRQYCQKHDIPLDQILRRVRGLGDPTGDVIRFQREQKSKRLEPIPSQDPPTFIRWRLQKPVATLYPGQRYSWVFETDAKPEYWNSRKPSQGQIRVLTSEVIFRGGDPMDGGRVRCHFQCPEDAEIGLRGMIQVQVLGTDLVQSFEIEVVPNRKQDPGEEVTEEEGDEEGPPGKKPSPDGKIKIDVINIKVPKGPFTWASFPLVCPEPITREHPVWSILQWPDDPAKAGMSLRRDTDQVRLYYNAELPSLLNIVRELTKSGGSALVEAFRHIFHMRLTLHAIFQLNHDFLDEGTLPVEAREPVRNLLCASVETVLHSAKSEIEADRKPPEKRKAAAA